MKRQIVGVCENGHKHPLTSTLNPVVTSVHGAVATVSCTPPTDEQERNAFVKFLLESERRAIMCGSCDTRIRFTMVERD